MSNESGQAYGLTVLSPVRRGEEEVLKDVLARLPTGSNAPFHHSAITHTARWVVVDALPQATWPPDRDPQGKGRFAGDALKSSYLLFDSNFDAGEGGLPSYLEALVTGMPTEIESIYTHCIGYTGLAQFAHYIDECQIKTTFFYSSYSTERTGTVRNVQAALRVQSGFVDLVAETQGRSPREVQDRLRQFFAVHEITAPVAS